MRKPHSRFIRVVAALAAMITLTACATNFTGSAYVPQGAQGCEAMCSEQGLEMAGMVMMGEYTDGCICAVPGFEAAALEAASTASGSAVGVMLQMRNSQSQSQSP